MTTTIADVRAALATAVNTVSGVTAFGYEADTIKTPGFYIGRKSFTPDLVLGGTKQSYGFTGFLFTQRTLERHAQIRLDQFCDMTGSLSIRTALENDANYTTNLVHYVKVNDVSAMSEASVAGVVYFVVQFDIEVVW